MTSAAFSLVLRLAGPLQSWGSHSQFNRRETSGEPTKSGIIGLLAAAQGLRRQDPIEKLLTLSLGVRTDQPGSLRRDYHTVSDYRGVPLLSSAVNKKGHQKSAGKKYTHLTERFYLEDAVFVAAVSGPDELLEVLAHALRRPAFPLALGRRTCVPTQPLLLRPPHQSSWLWEGEPFEALKQVPWQPSAHHRRQFEYRHNRPAFIDLPVTVDDPEGNDTLVDLPGSFDPKMRSFGSRPARHDWVRVPTGIQGDQQTPDTHDPFALLGW